MKKNKLNSSRTFYFDSGTIIDLQWKENFKCWSAAKFVLNTKAAHGPIIGLGRSKRLALKNLRDHLAMIVLRRLSPNKLWVILDEEDAFGDELFLNKPKQRR